MAKQVNLTYDSAVTLLRRAALEKGPDYKYSAPSGVYEYFDGAEPSCIIGHVLHYRGVTGEDLGVHNEDTDVNYLIGRGYIRCDDMTRNLLELAQAGQDDGVEWSIAVRDAVEYAEITAARQETSPSVR